MGNNMSEWIKVTDHMPELDDDGYSETVLSIGPDKMVYLNYLKDGEWMVPIEVTHWKPLPELSEDE